MTNLPKMRTQEDVTREQVEALTNGNERDRLMVLLGSMTGSDTRGLPETDDHDKLARDATEDFRRSNYSEAHSTVESLVLIVDFYKNLAEEYLSLLQGNGVAVDEYGSQTNNVFSLTENGEQVLGYSEVLPIEDHSREDLWEGYVKGYLPFAGASEKKYIAEKFGEFIKEETND